MAVNYCWEEEFTSERSTLTYGAETLGYVEPVGGSWQVFYRGRLAAIRPDKTTAQHALSKLVLTEGDES
jgi:hypothetical protein